MEEMKIVDLKDNYLYIYIYEHRKDIKIKVRSGEFEGTAKFWGIQEKIEEIVKSFLYMKNNLKGNCRISDTESISYIEFVCKKFGHVLVFGELEEFIRGQYLRFSFETDQTILDKLIKIFSSLR